MFLIKSSIIFPGILVRKVTPTHVILGHAKGGGVGGSGAYHLSAASVYRAPMLTGPHAMHIAAHGPDSECMVSKKGGGGQSIRCQRVPRVACDSYSRARILGVWFRGGRGGGAVVLTI